MFKAQFSKKSFESRVKEMSQCLEWIWLKMIRLAGLGWGRYNTPRLLIARLCSLLKGPAERNILMPKFSRARLS